MTTCSKDPCPEWPTSNKTLSVSALFKNRPEDFCVDEDLGFAPCGEGEHLFLRIQARNCNTEFVASQIAQFLSVPARVVSYSGLKDRVAVTRQWFSIHLPGSQTPDFSGFQREGIRIENALRHRKKLRRGVHRQNDFTLRLRGVTGSRPCLEKRIKLIRDAGYPNYFGEQRFGYQGNNLLRAFRCAESGRLPRKKSDRSRTYSVLRSFLFNEMLALRVRDNTWDSGIIGDSFVLKDSHSFFCEQVLDQDIKDRLKSGDIAPAGWLWGKGNFSPEAKKPFWFEPVLSENREIRSFLEKAGLQLAVRSLRMIPKNLQYHWEEGDLILRFGLSPGAYATSMLREIMTLER